MRNTFCYFKQTFVALLPAVFGCNAHYRAENKIAGWIKMESQLCYSQILSTSGVKEKKKYIYFFFYSGSSDHPYSQCE